MWKVLLAACCAVLVTAAPATAQTNGRLALESHNQIVTVNPDGTGWRTIWRATGQDESASQPVWSPDGNQLAYILRDQTRGGRVAIFDLRTATHRTITTHEGIVGPGSHTQDNDPGWTPDGRVLFRRTQYRQEGGKQALYAVDPDGTALTELPVQVEYNRTVTWSRDGWLLARDRQEATWIRSLDGAEETQLPFTGLRDPVQWSPDGDWLAYVDGAWLSVISLDGDDYWVTEPVATEEHRAPAWSPDGTSLVYAHTGLPEDPRQPRTSEIRVADVESGVTRKVMNGTFNAAAWQPCVAGVTVSCASSALTACRNPGEPEALDPQPLCLPPQPLPNPPAPPLPTVPAWPADTATYDRVSRKVDLRFNCRTRCTVTFRLSVKLNTGRVLKTRNVVRTGRIISTRVGVPAIPKRRRIASMRVVGTRTGADGVVRPFVMSVKR